MKKKLFLLGFICLSISVYSQNQLDDYFYTKVMIKGKEYRFLFDNGFSLTTVFSSKVDIKQSKKRKLKGNDPFQNQLEMNLSKRKISLCLPDFDLKYKLKLLVLPDAPQALLEHGVDGILGWDIISQHDWVFNFKDRTVKLLEEEDNSGYYGVKLFREKTYADFTSSNILKINEERKNIPFNFKLDLGFHGFLKCGINEIPRTEIDENLLKIVQTTTVAEKRIDTSFVQTVDLGFEDIHLTNIPIEYLPSERSPLIGLEFLKMFEHVILMNSQQTLLLKPIKSYQLQIPKIELHQGKIKEIITEAANLDKLKWKIGDEAKASEVDHFQWNIQVSKHIEN